MKKTSYIIIAAAALLAAASCSKKPQTGPAVLTGQIIGDCSQLVVLSYKVGEYTDYLYPVLHDGKFELELDDVEGFIDLAVAVDDDVFGARINANDTLGILVTSDGNGRFDIAYSGDTEKESRIWTDFYDAYGYWGQYNIRPDRDLTVSTDESIRMVDVKDSLFRAKYGSSLEKYYVKRADLMKGFLHAALLEMKSTETGEDYLADPEYAAIVRNLDPNDPLVLSCGLLNRWARYELHGIPGSEIERNTSFMDKYDKKIKSTSVRNMLAEFCAGNVFEDAASLESMDPDAFLGHLASFAPEYPQLVETCRQAYDAYFASRPGAAMPDVTLRDPEGKEIQLSSLFGKVLYIDMWATWCGPCVQQIPFLEELVERFKDNDDIMFLSISLDDTDTPWLEKIAADKPSWAQYWLVPEQASEFCGKLNISTIPRFIIVGREGAIADPDAPRPSDNGVDQRLLGL
ncbi:MAG: TlpA disulfide reductase family protein [Bacteroidia bacterium]|nr:TlpA disulfide reductase family protein [Bacteroidia bacterium]